MPMIRQDGEPKVHHLSCYITKSIMIHYNGMFPQVGECLQRRSASNVCHKNGGKRPHLMRVCSYKEAAM
jgi:hypothetical protein